MVLNFFKLFKGTFFGYTIKPHGPKMLFPIKLNQTPYIFGTKIEFERFLFERH